MKKQSLKIIISACALIILFGITWYQFSREARIMVNEVIVKDVERLQEIFKKINSECTISGFEHEKNYIDFLTVKSFVSHEVGSMELMFPSKWQGPYLPENPNVQGKKYEIVKTKYGYYIVPGTGVRLANGKIMGKDIIISAATDIMQLVNEQQGLEYNGKSLVALAWTPKNPPAVDLTQEDE